MKRLRISLCTFPIWYIMDILHTQENKICGIFLNYYNVSLTYRYNDIKKYLTLQNFNKLSQFIYFSLGTSNGNRILVFVFPGLSIVTQQLSYR